ncbi:hypothetical protein GF395_00005, partial [Candidatus Uhrbacteria bacterium]|nr:hypothetical protein [Candidatus Uhrbacteria bacterium]
MDIYHVCPNPTCIGNLKKRSVLPHDARTEVPDRPTMMFDVVMVTCDKCKEDYESVAERCPHCGAIPLESNPPGDRATLPTPID